jgi:hypothetical protein
LAVVFGFASYEVREVTNSRIKVLSFSVMVLSLMVTVETYYSVVMTKGQADKFVLLVSMSTLVFFIFFSFLVMWARTLFNEKMDKLISDYEESVKLKEEYERKT